jgi:LysM repeat protein
MQIPTKNPVTQGKHGQYNAVDYSAKTRILRRWNKTFYAPEAGKITAYGKSGQCGNRLELTAGKNRHGFCHLEKSLVKVGQTVKRGQALGVMGHTGYTIPSGVGGTHLHWVIAIGSKYIYPPTLVNQDFIIYKPSTKKYYRVRLGDNAIKIAAKHGISFAKFKKLNPKIKNYNWIFPGQKVRVK